jgi:serine/threonine-protein kinase HipA
MVDDEARAGALRFAETEGGPFLRREEARRISPLVALPQLLSAAEHVIEETDTEEDLRLLFAPGSSLGGARPKASVREKDGHLAIAKFPRKDDEISTVIWEAVARSPSPKRLEIRCPSRTSKPLRRSPCFCCDVLTGPASGVSRFSPP